jgi:hypothetical protein
MYDHIDDVINNLCSKYRINKSIATSSIDHVFNEIKNKIGDDGFPNVLIHNWGRFRPNVRYFTYKIKSLYKFIRESNPRQDHYDRLNKYITAYKRICKEEKIEFGEEFIEIENFIKSKFNEEVSK